MNVLAVVTKLEADGWHGQDAEAHSSMGTGQNENEMKIITLDPNPKPSLEHVGDGNGDIGDVKGDDKCGEMRSNKVQRW